MIWWPFQYIAHNVNATHFKDICACNAPYHSIYFYIRNLIILFIPLMAASIDKFASIRACAINVINSWTDRIRVKIWLQFTCEQLKFFKYIEMCFFFSFLTINWSEGIWNYFK